MDTQIFKADIIILGGGIAGLWALNRLKTLGYSVILLEANALGAGQTIKSQGIIHGGMKYALKGFLSRATNAIESMPERWKNCLAGSGEIDLHAVQLLSDHQLLFSTGTLSSELLSFLGSVSLNARVKKLSAEALPLILKNLYYKGHAYRLNEIVLDSASLLYVLAKPYLKNIYKINAADLMINLEDTDPNKAKDSNRKDTIKMNNSLIKNISIHNLQFKAKFYLFLAGEENTHLTQSLSEAPPMQLRPLRMVYAKFEDNLPFFAHCIDNGINPRITITTHKAKDGRTVWYLGGQIAEDGAKRSDEEQVQFAQRELHDLFPWFNQKNIEWGSFLINRAEPKQTDGKRPDNAYLKKVGNSIVAWPTKLALTPVLIDNMIATLEKDQQFQNKTYPHHNTDLEIPLETPQIAVPIWDQ